MGNLHSTLEGFRNLVNDTVKDLTVRGITIKPSVGIDWPAKPTFDQLVKTPQGCLISITDMRSGKNEQRFIGTKQSIITYPLGIAASLNKQVITPSGSATCTISYAVGQVAVQEHDAIGLAAHRGQTDQGATALANKNESLTSLSAKLAAAINARPVLTDWINATSSGAVVTLENLLTEPLKIEANVGNVEDRISEIGRNTVRVMVAVHTPDRDVRKVVGQSLEELFNTLASNTNNGFAVENDYPVRVQMNVPPTLMRDDFLVDLYRQNFLVDLEYTVTRTDRAYAILVGIEDREYE